MLIQLDVDKSTPLQGEERMRSLMENEATKYPPNFFWRISQWADRNEFLLMLFFLEVMTIHIAHQPTLSWSNIANAFIAGLLFVGVPLLFFDKFKKGPARWSKSQRNTIVTSMDEKIIEELRTEYPNSSFEIEVLHRAVGRQISPLAVVAWLLFPNPDKSVSRWGWGFVISSKG